MPLGGIRTRNPNKRAAADPRLDNAATGIGSVRVYVICCCSILGPATVGQYLDFETLHLKEYEVLIKVIQCYLKYE